jgi:hypothetical protein
VGKSVFKTVQYCPTGWEILNNRSVEVFYTFFIAAFLSKLELVFGKCRNTAEGQNGNSAEIVCFIL